MIHNIVIIDKKAPESVKGYFKRKNIRVIETQTISTLYPAISSHPDIQICKITDEIAVAAPEVYEYYKENLPGCHIFKGKSVLNGTYPFDIAYNVAIQGKLAFHSKKYTDSIILKVCEEEGISIANVKQGYSKCNAAFIQDGLITSDLSIYKAAKNNNMDVLLIQNDPSIKLEDFPYGFIGGASGLFGENTWVVCGDIRVHKNYDKILKFCLKHKTSVKCLYDGHILDIGSILYF